MVLICVSHRTRSLPCPSMRVAGLDLEREIAARARRHRSSPDVAGDDARRVAEPVVQLALLEVIALGVVPVVLGGEEPLEEVDPLEALRFCVAFGRHLTFSPDLFGGTFFASSLLLGSGGWRAWSPSAAAPWSAVARRLHLFGLDRPPSPACSTAGAISRAAPSKPPAFDERGPSLPSTGAVSARGALGSGGFGSRQRRELRIDLRRICVLRSPIGGPAWRRLFVARLGVSLGELAAPPRR